MEIMLGVILASLVALAINELGVRAAYAFLIGMAAAIAMLEVLRLCGLPPVPVSLDQIKLG